MEYMTPNFTKDMVKTHKILIPNMAVTQFRLMQAALASEGYQTEVLGNCGSEVAQLGLKYVHNDTCYPALLVIGQFLDALNSGKYDLDHTALLITQTGGGCRASNYIHLLRKALVKAGYPQIPVASLNFCHGAARFCQVALMLLQQLPKIRCHFFFFLFSGAAVHRPGTAADRFIHLL